MEDVISRQRSVEFIERIKRLENAEPQLLENSERKRTSPIHIVYLLTHTSVCGGVKIILEHANGLQKMGLKVSLVSHFPAPDWYPIEAEYITVPFELELTRAIPLCDLIVATYWDHIHACIETGIAPVVYFEQGDFHLFEPSENVELMPQIHRQFQLPPHLITVSRPVQELIKNRFGRDSLVFPNALNPAVFYPKTEKQNKKFIMIAGSDQMKFKGIDDLLKAFQLVKEKGIDVELLWLTPNQPEKPVGEVHVNPPQSQIGDLYRKASIFVCGSHYEAFSLPCLEAMACGTPVVTTTTPGVKEYAKDGYNCLMTNPGDVVGIAERILELLEDEALYTRLQTAGYETTKRYSWNEILKDLADFYLQVAQTMPTPKYQLNEWTLYTDDKKLVEPDSKERLESFLTQTNANIVCGPVEYRLNADIVFFIWEPLAQRKTPLAHGSIEKILIKAKGEGLPDWPWQELACDYQTGNYIGAMTKAKERIAQVQLGTPDQAVNVRWIILCLLGLEQYKIAEQLIAQAISTYPLYTDLYLLSAKCARLGGNEQLARDCINISRLIREAIDYPEYFDVEAFLAAIDSKKPLNQC